MNQLHIDLGQIGQLLDQATDTLLDPGADVVDLPGHAACQQCEVGGHHVADIEKIACHIDVADLQLRHLQALFDPADLSCGAGDHEALRLPGTDVVEGAGDHDRPAFGHAPLQAQHFRRELAHGIGVARAGWLMFVDRQGALADLAVDIAGTDIQEGTVEATRLERLQQVQRTQQVDLKGVGRVTKGFGNEGLARQMDYCVRAFWPQSL
ncbi:hypothetical protein D3C85_530710 [compost metagenome]